MATDIATVRSTAIGRLQAAPFDRFLAAGAVVVFLALVAALLRGRAHWGTLPWQLWVHIATIAVALVLTPPMMLRRRGDRWHRWLGYIWAGMLMATALVSFDIRMTGHGRFSFIHLLSIWTLIQVPLLVVAARRHQHARHRSAVRGMVVGALLIAGFFTFPFGRLLGTWIAG